jgi:hypothetical protein
MHEQNPTYNFGGGLDPSVGLPGRSLMQEIRQIMQDPEQKAELREIFKTLVAAEEHATQSRVQVSLMPVRITTDPSGGLSAKGLANLLREAMIRTPPDEIEHMVVDDLQRRPVQRLSQSLPMASMPSNNRPVNILIKPVDDAQ